MIIPIMQIDNERRMCLIEICSLRSDFIITISSEVIKKKTCQEMRERKKMNDALYLLDPNYYIYINSSHSKKK